MEYKLDCGILGGIFAVPNAVVDNFIKLASGEAVKVLLYMLRHSGQTFSSKEIAAALNIKEEQAEEAFVFWENANIFSSSPVAAPEQKLPKTETIKPLKAAKKTKVPDRSNYNISPSEIAERIEGSDEIKGFFLTAESLFGKPLTHTQMRSFIHILDYVCIPAEVLLTIIAYSLKAEKGSTGYIEALAYDFFDRGLTTLELAQREIKHLEEKYSYEGKIKSIFGIQSNFSTKQKKIVEEWQQKNVSTELIRCAYDISVDGGKGPNIPYVNGTLLNWEKDGITTVEQAMNEKKKFGGTNEGASFDINDIMSLANDFGDI